MNLQNLWQKLVTREKALFKSATMWLAAMIAAAPDMLAFAQANFPTISQYLPSALHDPVMRFIGLAIFLCRLRSMVKIPPAAPLPPPQPGTTSSSDVARMLILALLVGVLASATIGVAAEVPIEKDAPQVEGHPLTSVVVTQCSLVVAVYTTMPDGRLLRFDKSSNMPVNELMDLAYTATRSERVEVGCADGEAARYEKRDPI